MLKTHIQFVTTERNQLIPLPKFLIDNFYPIIILMNNQLKVFIRSIEMGDTIYTNIEWAAIHNISPKKTIQRPKRKTATHSTCLAGACISLPGTGQSQCPSEMASTQHAPHPRLCKLFKFSQTKPRATNSRLHSPPAWPTRPSFSFLWLVRDSHVPNQFAFPRPQKFGAKMFLWCTPRRVTTHSPGPRFLTRTHRCRTPVTR